MGSKREHCQKCKEDLGKEFEEVHKWLDALASKWIDDKHYIDVNHRRFRHHKEGVEEIREMLGDEAAKAAEHHIKLDFSGNIPDKSYYKNHKECLYLWEEVFGNPYGH